MDLGKRGTQKLMGARYWVPGDARKKTAILSRKGGALPPQEGTSFEGNVCRLSRELLEMATNLKMQGVNRSARTNTLLGTSFFVGTVGLLPSWHPAFCAPLEKGETSRTPLRKEPGQARTINALTTRVKTNHRQARPQLVRATVCSTRTLLELGQMVVPGKRREKPPHWEVKAWNLVAGCDWGWNRTAETEKPSYR